MMVAGQGNPAPLFGDDMRKIELDTIEIAGEEYPIYCDLYVLSQIQERMSLNDFERKIIGAKIIRNDDGTPQYDENKRIKLEFDEYDINALLLGLTYMVNEGLLIKSEQEGTEYEPFKSRQLGSICDLSPTELSSVVANAFNKCVVSKKKRQTKSQTRKKNT